MSHTKIFTCNHACFKSQVTCCSYADALSSRSLQCCDLYHKLFTENQIFYECALCPYQFIFLFSADIGRAIGISVSPVLDVLLVIIVMMMAFLLWKKGSKYIRVQY